MGYIYVSADCIEPSIQGASAFINDSTLTLFKMWNESYQGIITMSVQERVASEKEIEKLDFEGEKLCFKLLVLSPEDSKLEYFSEGKLRKTFWLEKKNGVVKKYII